MEKIKKVKINNGVFWVGIPEVDLYILCGCPADSVKHLMKYGFIRQVEKQGVEFEIGPNSILLSDVLIQNGQFSNLAEFPVLQMLYRQGMILPNHPNNTGIKPILIGLEDQVQSQMEYIHRGNYGLTSQEEIEAAGIDSEQAKEMMEMKLKFSFGQIKPTEELLDSVIVHAEKTEIRNGVYITRTGFNQYKIEYEDVSLSVDMNLHADELYNPPYKLGFHHFHREYFSVLHAGEGDGWDINRPCMGSILVFQGKIYLIDAGPNISYILQALGIDTSEIEGIFHTHCHDDHMAGLSSLMRSGHQMKYFATTLVRHSVGKKLAALMSISQGKLENYFEIHDLEFDKWNNIEGLEVKPFFSPHPVETNIFIFRSFWENSYRSYAHYADVVSFSVLEQMKALHDPDGSGISEEFFEKVQNEYLTTVDVKKIDIGGGLIHGQADDFSEDASEKIILSHSSNKLTNLEKEIGSEAPFGACDILIPSNQDYLRLRAENLFQLYFPSLPHYEIETLLNYPVVSFNAGTILIRRGKIPEYVYFSLSGSIECIQMNMKIQQILPTGSFIGYFNIQKELPETETYRTASSVHVLQFPGNFFRQFIERNSESIYTDVVRIHSRMIFLRRSWLFGDSVPYIIRRKLVENMTTHHMEKGKSIVLNKNSKLYLLKKGKVRLLYNHLPIDILQNSGFFGEDPLLLEESSQYEAYFEEDSIVFSINLKKVLEIPCVHWKLLEIYEKRKRHIQQ